MSVIWWTIYILGAFTILIFWIQLMALVGTLFKVIREKEWTKVKVVSGPPGPKGESCGLSRKDIEALIRMEVSAHLYKFEISRTTFPGLGIDDVKLKSLGDWQTNQSPVNVDKLIDEYHKKEDK